MSKAVIPTFEEEQALAAQGFSCVAGTDEVGCGCWAGPVMAAAVILPVGVELMLVRDSKALSPAQRERSAEEIKAKAAAWAVGSASVEEVDQLNIRRAAALAMTRAIASLPIRPDYVLSDAFRIPGLDIPLKNIIRGDAKVVSIAAASIIAKVARDRLMDELAAEHPGYGFERHKGYGTKEHQQALERQGICPIHRRTYAPIKKFLAKT
ncbi:MAG: ribonuclease HII [Patescibacteria group bacterium]|jgi:ribonuclease HII